MNLRTAIEQFELSCAAQRLSPKTLRAYHDHLQGFLKVTGNIAVRLLAPSHLNSYLAWYSERPGRAGAIRSSSVAKGYAVVRRFCRWAYQQGLVDKSPTDKVKPPTLDEPMIEVLTEEEIDRLLAYVSGDFRDKVIFELFLDTGCRLAEVAGICVKDVNLDQRCVKVMGKGRREGIVPIGRTVARDLHIYMTRHRAKGHENVDEDALFLNRSGQPLGYEGIASMIRRTFRKVGIKGRAHKLRHTFATSFLRSGGNLHVLQRILRHRSIHVTEQYLHLVQDDLLSEHDRCGPLDRWMVKR